MKTVDTYLSIIVMRGATETADAAAAAASVARRGIKFLVFHFVGGDIGLDLTSTAVAVESGAGGKCSDSEFFLATGGVVWVSLITQRHEYPLQGYTIKAN